MDLMNAATKMLGESTSGGSEQARLIAGLVRMLSGGAGGSAPSAPAGLGSLAAAVTSGPSNAGSGSTGLAGLVSLFAGKGLGEVATSWVSTGPNLPITAEQLQSVLGSDRIATLAASAGVTPETAAKQLTGLLPTVVDKLTPDGVVPREGLVEQGLALLKGFTA